MTNGHNGPRAFLELGAFHAVLDGAFHAVLDSAFQVALDNPFLVALDTFHGQDMVAGAFQKKDKVDDRVEAFPA